MLKSGITLVMLILICLGTFSTNLFSTQTQSSTPTPDTQTGTIDRSFLKTAQATPTFFPVGQGFTDVIPHQVIRTKDDRVYIFAGQGDPSAILKVYWTTSPGTPANTAAFAGATQVTASNSIISVDTAYDGTNLIHVLINTQGGLLQDYVFNITTNQFATPLTLASGNPTFNPGGGFIGTSGVSVMFDNALTLHLAYWAGGNHIVYRAYTYNSANATLTLTAGPTQLDSSGSANHPVLAVSPLDSTMTVAWVSEATSPKKILARTFSAASGWGAIETVSASPVWTSTQAGINIDQGPSLIIGWDGTRHLTYIQDFDQRNTYGHVHYVSKKDAGWVDVATPGYSHDPALAIDSAGNLYIFGHGGGINAGCLSNDDMCYMQQNADGSWGEQQLFATHTSGISFDASPSTKWSVVGFNRPETVELLFFALTNSGTTIYYGRLNPADGCNYLFVINNMDIDICGTLRHAINFLTANPSSPNKSIIINLPQNTTITLQGSGLVLPAGASIFGVCLTKGGPAIVLDGTGISQRSLTLSGNSTVKGLLIKSNLGIDITITAHQGAIKLGCSKITRKP